MSNKSARKNAVKELEQMWRSAGFDPKKSFPDFLGSFAFKIYNKSLGMKMKWSGYPADVKAAWIATATDLLTMGIDMVSGTVVALTTAPENVQTLLRDLESMGRSRVASKKKRRKLK